MFVHHGTDFQPERDTCASMLPRLLAFLRWKSGWHSNSQDIFTGSKEKATAQPFGSHRHHGASNSHIKRNCQPSRQCVFHKFWNNADDSETKHLIPECDPPCARAPLLKCTAMSKLHASITEKRRTFHTNDCVTYFTKFCLAIKIFIPVSDFCQTSMS